MTLTKKQQDLEFGGRGELSILKHLNDFFGVDIIKTKSITDPFDFETKTECKRNIKIELKTRRNTKDKYPTTMVGLNKVEKGLELLKPENGGYEIYFYFKFTDGLYYYKLEEDSYKDYTIEKGGRVDRGRPEIKKYVFIPVCLLLAP